MDFYDLDLSDNTLDAIDDMGWTSCTPIQEKCIPEILDGKDVLGIAQTGTGKTAAYLLPILSMLDDGGFPENSINCVIMSPTRELAQQIDQAKHTESSSTRDRDKARVPLVLINRHVPIVLLESAQNATEQQQYRSDSEIHQNLVHLLLHRAEHPRYTRSQIRQKDRVHQSQDSLTLKMVSSIHINHRRAVIHVLFSQQFQVDVAVNSASTIAEQTVISVSTGSRIADGTARSRDELRNGPMTSRERG